MSKQQRLSLKRTLEGLERERANALAPVLKSRRAEEAKIAAPFDDAIAKVEEQLKKEEDKAIWIVMRRSPHNPDLDMQNMHCVGEALRGAYLTIDEAVAECPDDSKDHRYFVQRVSLHRSMSENKLKDEPPSR